MSKHKYHCPVCGFELEPLNHLGDMTHWCEECGFKEPITNAMWPLYNRSDIHNVRDLDIIRDVLIDSYCRRRNIELKLAVICELTGLSCISVKSAFYHLLYVGGLFHIELENYCLDCNCAVMERLKTCPGCHDRTQQLIHFYFK